MSDDTRTGEPSPTSVRDTGPLLLAAGGFAAALGAASCCALPLLFGTLGLGTAWLAALAGLAAPYRLALLAAAIGCLAGGAAMLLRRRAIAACAPGAACARSPTVAVTIGILSLGAVFAVLGLIFA